VRQPLKQLQRKGSLSSWPTVVRGRLHARLKLLVEECGGSYVNKSPTRCVQKVEQEYDGDYSKLLDLERATGLFEQPGDMLRCLQRVQADNQFQEPTRPATTASGALQGPPEQASGERLQGRAFERVRCAAGFVAELQLNFNKIAQINSQTHRFYEPIRIMDIKWAQTHAKQAVPAVRVPKPSCFMWTCTNFFFMFFAVIVASSSPCAKKKKKKKKKQKNN